MLFISEAMAFLLLLSISHTFLCSNILQSTIPHPLSGWAPFLSRKELRFANFPFVSFYILSFYKKTFRFVPAILEDCTVPRIRSGFLPTYERFAFIPTRKWLCYFCRQRTKFAAFPLSFMHRQQTKFAALRTFRCTPQRHKKRQEKFLPLFRCLKGNYPDFRSDCLKES